MGRDDGPVVFLLSSQMLELISDAFSLDALGGLPWGGAGSHACFLSHRKDSEPSTVMVEWTAGRSADAGNV